MNQKTLDMTKGKPLSLITAFALPLMLGNVFQQFYTVVDTAVVGKALGRCMKVKSEREVAQSCPTLSDPMDCSPPGFSVHGILQARILE